ncbi:MAG: hypothetical protein LH467_06795 [Gemmatimonadaceae bacterium]|nr:hypothetical protein [Gemmatimonadaceae bacterium]
MERTTTSGSRSCSPVGGRRPHRTALEGELHLLAETCRETDEIAGIADDMFLSTSVQDAFERLK